MSLCTYKHIFGEPNTGIHSVRIFNIAIFDVISTIIVCIVFYEIVIVILLKMNDRIKFWMVLLFFFVLGIILHRAFCVKTAVDKLIFGE